MDNTYQIHNLYNDVVLHSVQDSIGAYIDQELEVFRSENNTGKFYIQVSPQANLDWELRQVSELHGIQYCIHMPTLERYVGYRGVYWRFDELSDPLMHVFYSSDASPGRVWSVAEQWIKIALLQRDWMAVHSCAFIYQDIPVVVAGWQGLGKSKLLHYALAQGADYMSDDFTLVSASGAIRGYPPGFIDIHDHILQQHSEKAGRGGQNQAISSTTKLMYTSFAWPILMRGFKSIARRMGYDKKLVKRIRMDKLHPGINVVLRTSAPLWLVLLPVANGLDEIQRNVIPSETVERILAGTLTDFYFMDQYDRFLYQAGKRALNDSLILDVRKKYRDILLTSLEQARDVWVVNASMALHNPERLFTLVQDLNKVAVT